MSQSVLTVKGSEKRSETLGTYIIEAGCTVREAAAYFGISKSTVHKDVTERLKKENPRLCAAVKKILQKNKDERHIRGGEATKKKYQMEKKERRKI